MRNTTRDIVVNARLDADTLSRLDALADEMQRSRSCLIAQAVRDFIELEDAFLSAVKEGEADVEAGRTLSHDDALKWAEKLKSGRISDLPAPTPTKHHRA